MLCVPHGRDGRRYHQWKGREDGRPRRRRGSEADRREHDDPAVADAAGGAGRKPRHPDRSRSASSGGGSKMSAGELYGLGFAHDGCKECQPLSAGDSANAVPGASRKHLTRRPPARKVSAGG